MDEQMRRALEAVEEAERLRKDFEQLAPSVPPELSRAADDAAALERIQSSAMEAVQAQAAEGRARVRREREAVDLARRSVDLAEEQVKLTSDSQEIARQSLAAAKGSRDLSWAMVILAALSLLIAIVVMLQGRS